MRGTNYSCLSVAVAVGVAVVVVPNILFTAWDFYWVVELSLQQEAGKTLSALIYEFER